MKTYRVSKEKIHPSVKDEDLLPYGCLYIKGWLENGWDGIGVKERKDDWRSADSIVRKI